MACGQCKAMFESRQSLEKHVKDAHFHFCPHCSVVFQSESVLETHVKEQHVHICSECKNIFTTPEDRDRHWKERHLFVCTKCACTFKSEDAFENHMKREHPEKPKMPPKTRENPRQGQSGPTKVKVERAAASSTRDTKKTPLICRLCKTDPVFSSPKELIDHTRIQHNKFLCLACSIIFESRDRFQEHRRDKHGDNYPKAPNQPRQEEVPRGIFQPIRCCKHSILKSPNDVMRHIRKAHSIFVCPVCPQSFSEAKGLVLHSYDEHEHERRACCTRCPSHKEFQMHVEQAHASFSCSTCQPPLQINSGPAFEMHMRSEHPTFVCYSCFRMFNTPEDLRKHIDIGDHSIHSCVKCRREFPGKDLLNSHLKYTHGLLVCKMCDMMFPTDVMMEEHIRGNHPSLKCTACGIDFQNRSYLEAHVQFGQCRQKSKKSPVSKPAGGAPKMPSLSVVDLVESVETIEDRHAKFHKNVQGQPASRGRQTRGRSRSPGKRQNPNMATKDGGQYMSGPF